MAKKEVKAELNENKLEGVSGGVMSRLTNNSPHFKKGYRFKVTTDSYYTSRADAAAANRHLNPQEYTQEAAESQQKDAGVK